MNRERARGLLPVIEAFARGEAIQVNITDEWYDIGEINCVDGLAYRIKPIPREFAIAMHDDTTKGAQVVEGHPGLTEEYLRRYYPDLPRIIRVREVL